MRTVRHETDVDRALQDAAERWQGAQDIWDSIVLNLSLDPTVGRPLNEAGTVRSWTLHGARSNDIPTLTILYKYDGGHIVSIETARFEDATAYQIGRA